MPNLVYGSRPIRMEQRHFWADGGDDFFIVSQSLADVIAAIDITEDSYADGTQPDWENRWNKVTVIAGLATRLPQHAAPETVSVYPDKIFRTEPSDRSKNPLWWVRFVPEGSDPTAPFVRAFNTKERAETWINAAAMWSHVRADADHFEDIERRGFWGS